MSEQLAESSELTDDFVWADGGAQYPMYRRVHWFVEEILDRQEHSDALTSVLPSERPVEVC